MLRRLCPTFTPSIKWIQADYDIDYGTRIGLKSSNTRGEIRTPNPTKLQLIKIQNVLQICNYIIQKNRIFLYLENEVKNLNNIIIIVIINNSDRGDKIDVLEAASVLKTSKTEKRLEDWD